MSAKRYSDLIVWQKAMNLVEEVYTMAKQFPKDETYGLASQLRRAAVSIPSNIAEGHGRTGGREFAHRLSITHGSLGEVETQIEIARRLRYITVDQQKQLLAMASETGRLMNGLMNALERNVATSNG